MSSLIPDEELEGRKILNLTPMVDFLFLLVAIFAVFAVTRTVLVDTEVSPVKVHTDKLTEVPQSEHLGYTILLSINEEGRYKWISEFNEFLLEGVLAVKQELAKQQELGLLPEEKEQTRILLQIDKSAPWESVATLIFAVKEEGYAVSPLY